MRVIFLDIDGVLNTYSAKFEQKIRPDKMAVLQDIILIFNVEIVVSSDWRRLGKGRFLEKSKFLADWLHEDWCTVWNGDEPFTLEKRTTEIQEWLSRHPEVDIYAVLDDLPIYLDNSIRIDNTVGLSRDHIPQLQIFFS